MNKQEVITNFHAGLSKLCITLKEAIVITGANLVLRGLREETNDIDIVVSYDVLQRILGQGVDLQHDHDVTLPNGDTVAVYHGKSHDFEVAVVTDPVFVGKVEELSGIQCADLRSVLTHKEFMNRDKDEGDIHAIRTYLQVREHGSDGRILTTPDAVMNRRVDFIQSIKQACDLLEVAPENFIVYGDAALFLLGYHSEHGKIEAVIGNKDYSRIFLGQYRPKYIGRNNFFGTNRYSIESLNLVICVTDSRSFHEPMQQRHGITIGWHKPKPVAGDIEGSKKFLENCGVDLTSKNSGTFGKQFPETDVDILAPITKARSEVAIAEMKHVVVLIARDVLDMLYLYEKPVSMVLYLEDYLKHIQNGGYGRQPLPTVPGKMPKWVALLEHPAWDDQVKLTITNLLSDILLLTVSKFKEPGSVTKEFVHECVHQYISNPTDDGYRPSKAPILFPINLRSLADIDYSVSQLHNPDLPKLQPTKDTPVNYYQSQMKSYVGTKLLDAVPMCLGTYNTLQGWTIPPDQDPMAEGYLVEYKDGGKPNHKDFAGYISWSPKEVFENSYRETKGLGIGAAVQCMLKGERVRTATMKARNEWITKSGPEPVDLDAAKFWNKHNQNHALANGGTAKVLQTITMKTSDGSIQMGWAPQVSDLFDTTWEVVPEGE